MIFVIIESSVNIKIIVEAYVYVKYNLMVIINVFNIYVYLKENYKYIIISIITSL